MGQKLSVYGLPGWWRKYRPQRILVVGSSGSGKTTLAKKLGQALQIPAYDLDDLAWLPRWQLRELRDFRAQVRRVAEMPHWILAGNYQRTHDLTWPKADMVIWLDLALPCIFWRVFQRTFKRTWTGEFICNGNQESLYLNFFTKESLLLWQIQHYQPLRQRYLERLADSQQPPMLILSSPAEVRRFQAYLRGLIC